LPRLIEIFDARKSPSTPLMEIYLESEFNDEKHSKVLAEKIREVTLEDVISEIKVNFAEKKIDILLNKDAVKRIHSEVEEIAKKLEEKEGKTKVRGEVITILLPDLDFKEIYRIKEKLKKTVVSGVKGIRQILVAKRDKNFVILTAGTNLKEIIKMVGINKEKTTSNDIHEVAKVLGIEAARQTIINEIKKVIDSQGLDIDERHLKLVADAMTQSGEVKGVTRMGIISEKSSILARASFETPIKQFVNATVKASKDELASVIENIILNQPVPVGTGLPGLMVKVIGSLSPEKKEKSSKKAQE
jgi:DNA-directed RNA polymerase subunit A"